MTSDEILTDAHPTVIAPSHFDNDGVCTLSDCTIIVALNVCETEKERAQVVGQAVVVVVVVVIAEIFGGRKQRSDDKACAPHHTSDR